jgi:hypothetical protein
MSSQLSHQQRQTLERLKLFRQDLELYSKSCLKIRDKTGSVMLFPGFNSAQKHLHARLEQQKKETGKVRAIVLKGRQQGVSTYTAMRFYGKASMHRGVGVYILSHEQSASDNLFKMVDRFQVHNPLRPHTGTDNAKELDFDRLDSSYVVATAGQKAGGRGRTITLFHGSEVAFWQSAQDHFASSVQTVPDMPGTEIILESTGNGASGEFYERWQDATNKVGDYEAIFIPWFWQEEYSRPVPPDFELSDEPGDNGVSEMEYARLFNLSHEQMAWRRAKVAELRSVQLFDQEYPASPEMAFTSADTKKSYILPIQVLRARKRKNVEAAGPLIIGADPSGPGKDRFAVAARQGHKVLWIEHRQMPEQPEAILWLRSIMDEHKPDRMFIDLGNMGHGIFTHIKAMGKPYSEIIRGVNFGSTSQSKLARPKVPGPKNRRAEMWQRLLDWLTLEEGVSLPDLDILQADITGPQIKPQVSGDFLLESKKEMKARGVRSPDLADALVLTFAEIEWIVRSEANRTAGARKATSAPRTLTAASPPPAPSIPLISGPNSWMGF